MDELLSTLAHEVGAATGRLWVRAAGRVWDRRDRMDWYAVGMANDYLNAVLGGPMSCARTLFMGSVRWHIVRLRDIH